MEKTTKLKKITIGKTINFKEGSVEFRYVGSCDENDASVQYAEELIDNYVLNYKDRGTESILDAVTVLKTILQNYKEELFVFYFENNKNFEQVKYDLGHLFLFEMKRTENDGERYYVKFEPQSGIRIDYNYRDEQVNLASPIGSQCFTQKTSEVMNLIGNLVDITPTKLETLDEDLIQVYKAFYNENPDFSDPNINIKVQSMLVILEEFGLKFFDKYNYYFIHYMQGNSYPNSPDLEVRINELYPYGEIEVDENNSRLTEKAKKRMKIINESILTAIGDNDLVEALKVISTVVFTSKRNLATDQSDVISKFTSIDIQTVEDNLKLVRKIKEKFEKTGD